MRVYRAPQRRQAVAAAGVQRLFEGDPVSAEDPVESQPRSSQPGAVVVRSHKFQKANKHRYSSWMSSIGELQLSANIWTAPRLEHETKPPQISSESGRTYEAVKG